MIVWPSILVFCIGAFLVVAGGVLGWVVFPSRVEEQVIESVRLETGTEQFERWESLPFPLLFKVYLFEVLNPEEVQQGANPNLQERGPYVYNQYRRKVEVQRDGDELTYRQIQTYEFNAEASYPLTEDDNIVTFNVPYHAIIQTVHATSPGLVAAINAVSTQIFNGQGVFLSTTVGELLFSGVPICPEGRPVIQCNIIAGVGSKNMRVGEDGTIYFSIFNHKNATDDGLYTVLSGETDISDVGRIVEWEGNNTLTFWPDNEDNSTSICNMVNGTDASIYAPFARGRRSMQIYSSDICRSVTTHYQRDASYMGIPGMMFRTMEDMLPEPSLEDETACFCIGQTPGILQENGCLKKGAMELYTCFDSHTVLSAPHFLMAHEDYQNGVNGLNPDPELHQTFVIIEPNTGSSLTGGKRVQFNMFLRNIANMAATQNLTTTLFPFVWLDEGIELSDEMIDMLNDRLISTLAILEAVKWSLVGVGIGLVVIGAIWFIAACSSRGKSVRTV